MVDDRIDFVELHFKQSLVARDGDDMSPLLCAICAVSRPLASVGSSPTSPLGLNTETYSMRCTVEKQV